MVRHILLTLCLAAAALCAGFALVPGEREQWTMLMRDDRNADALAILERRYDAGGRDADAVLAYYKLLMSYARVDRADEVIEAFAAAHPGNSEVLALLAKHYADTQNRPGEVAALEGLFALEP